MTRPSLISIDPGTKKCTKCGVPKHASLLDFPADKRVGSGLAPRCRPCSKEDGQLYYHKNKPKYIAYYQLKNGRNKKSPEHFLRQKEYRQRLRKGVLEAYGGKCMCCGESQFEFLAIDHKNGNGRADRQILKNLGISLYHYLKKNNYPKDDYQLLCHNCNCAKGYYGQCPHAQNA